MGNIIGFLIVMAICFGGAYLCRLLQEREERVDVHDLRIILKVTTGHHIEDEYDGDLKDLIDQGLIYKTQIGYGTSSETLRKLERICKNWEEI